MTDHGKPPHLPGPILVVDDDSVLCDFIKMALTEQGYEAITAGDGAQALLEAEACTPSLVFMDVGMPGLSGRELAVHIQEVCRTLVPCVVMSGSRPDDGFVDGPVVDYLAKPFGVDELFAVAQRYAGLQQPAPAS